MSFEAGSISYTIDAKTGALLTADKQVSSFNKSAQEGFERTAASMSKLTSVAKAVSAALVSSQIISYAQSWNELEDRIQNTGATASQTKDILDQLLVTSDRNGRTIEETSELYIRLSNSMGELGYSTQSTISYIDTLSNLMTINKTNSLSAESATNALTKAQMKGKLAGVEAMTVFNAMPSILKTLGKQLNKTESEVRKMASDGKLSMSEFTEAMIAAQEETAALADNMRNTVTEGINRVTNNLKKYLGELNNSTGATKLLVDSLILMSQHVDILMTGVGALAAVYAGKYITSLASATKQSAEKVINDIKLAQAEKAAAQAALQQAQAEVAHLRAVQQSLAAQLKLAQTETTRNAIRKQLKANTDALTAATNQQTAAQARLDTAMKATSFAANGLRSAMALLGGPAGMLFLAAGALTTWASKADDAKQKALDFSDSVDSMSDSLKSLTLNQLLDKQLDYCDNLENIENQIKNVVSKINEAKAKITAAKSSFDMHPDTIKDAEREIVRLNSTLDKLIQKKSNASKIISYINTLLIGTSADADSAATGVDGFAKALEKVGTNKIDEKVKSLSTQLEIANMKIDDSRKAAYIYENVLNDLGSAGEEYKGIIRDLIKDSTKWATVSEEVRKVLEPLFKAYAALFDANEKLNASKKRGGGTTRTYAEEIKNLKNQLEVAKLEAQHLTVEAKALAISQQIGTKATAAQTEELKRLIQEQENLRKYQSGEEFAKQEIYNKKSPLEQINIDEQEKLDKLNEWRATGLANEQTYQDALTAITKDAVDKRKKLEDEAAEAKLKSTSAILQSSADLFGGMSDMLGAFAGESSSAYKALFAISKGFAIADAMLNLNSAIMKAMNDPTAVTTSAKMANMAAVASAGGQVLSTLKGLTYGGGRLRGGGVDVGKAYRVNESGEPELFVAHGKQYMIPNKNGEVIPSNKLSGSAGRTIINNITQNISFGENQDNTTAANETARMLKQAIKSVMQEEQRPGGMLNRR
ncbi:tape measure protein [Gilliamella sp. B3482]|uniref:tape measure protein n=1 Tax=Gilliamella sp. B3482 TaxID=2817991 RepID=UPI00226AD506|nr:tape measure protein [Gilliamella sp. B3482]MCX8581150.1 tape measure protein [Gilliamella sp. B3482]